MEKKGGDVNQGLYNVYEDGGFVKAMKLKRLKYLGRIARIADKKRL